jgi:hypothetical protein
MAATYADELVIVHHDDRRTRYTGVTYCLWPGGVTVYLDRVQIARHDDVLDTRALRLAVSPAARVTVGPWRGRPASRAA